MLVKIDEDYLKTVLDCLMAVGDECVFELESDGLSVGAVGPVKAAMVELELSKDGFEELALEEDDSLGINLPRLEEVTSMSSDSTVEITSGEDMAGKIRVVHGRMDYTMSLISTEMIDTESNNSISDIQLNTSFNAPLEEIQNGVKACGKVSDRVNVEVSEDGVVFSSSGDTDDIEYRVCESTCDEEVTSTFSQQIMSNVFNSLPDKDEVEIQVGNDMPVVCETEFAEGDGEVRFAIAPKVESY